jgi:hemerythrin-like domain-containing protein
MAEPMSMNRLIHGAVRRDLARFLDALAAFPDGDKRRAAQLGRAWDFFRGELDYHHRGEHAIAWPALKSVGVDDAVIAQMDAEHDKLADALAAAGDKMHALVQTPGKAVAGDAHAAMATLTDVAEEHLTHEERDVDPVYVANRNSPEMKAMGKKFSRDRKPGEAGNFFAWLQNGAGPEEQASLGAEVPKPVVFILGRLLGRRYRTQIAPVWR